MQKKWLLLATILSGMAVSAQKGRYRSYNYVALLTGERQTAFQAVSTHGINWGANFLGIGVGFDSYRYTSFPLFLSASRDLFAGKNGLYANLNAGTVFVSSSEMGSLWLATDSRFLPGFLGEAGFGYRFPLKGKDTDSDLLLGTYYSYKGFREKFTMPPQCATCSAEYEYINYHLHRWAFKLGISF